MLKPLLSFESITVLLFESSGLLRILFTAFKAIFLSCIEKEQRDFYLTFLKDMFKYPHA